MTCSLIFLLASYQTFVQNKDARQKLLRVYDTDGSYSGKTPAHVAVSNIEIKECSFSRNTFIPDGLRHLEVLKKPRNFKISVLNCKVKITPELGYCGHDGGFSYHYQAAFLKPYDAPIDANQCSTLVKGMPLSIALTYGNKSGRVVISGNNRWPVTKRETIFGQVNSDASCTGETMTSSNGSKNKRVIYSVWVETTAVKYEGTIIPAAKKIVVRNVIYMNFSQTGTHTDQELGTFYYNYTHIPKTECDQFRVVYRGDGLLLKANKGRRPSIIRVRDSEQNDIMIFQLTTPIKICNYDGYRTEEDEYFIVILKEKQKTNIPHATAGIVTDRDVDVNRIRTLHLDTNIAIEQDIRRILSKLCISEKRLLQGLMSVIGGDFGETEGTVDFNMVGRQISNRGAASYIISGNPMKATLRSMEECCEELPIYLHHTNGEVAEAFSDPRTSVIRPYCSPRTCDSIFPYVYYAESYIEDNQSTSRVLFCTYDSAKVIPCKKLPTKLRITEFSTQTHISKSLKSQKPQILEPAQMRTHHLTMLLQDAKTSVVTTAAKAFVAQTSMKLTELPTIKKPWFDEILGTLASSFTPISSLYNHLTNYVKNTWAQVLTGGIVVISAGIAATVLACVLRSIVGKTIDRCRNQKIPTTTTLEQLEYRVSVLETRFQRLSLIDTTTFSELIQET